MLELCNDCYPLFQLYHEFLFSCLFYLLYGRPADLGLDGLRKVGVKPQFYLFISSIKCITVYLVLLFELTAKKCKQASCWAVLQPRRVVIMHLKNIFLSLNITYCRVFLYIFFVFFEFGICLWVSLIVKSPVTLTSA